MPEYICPVCLGSSFISNLLLLVKMVTVVIKCITQFHKKIERFTYIMKRSFEIKPGDDLSCPVHQKLLAARLLQR